MIVLIVANSYHGYHTYHDLEKVNFSKFYVHSGFPLDNTPDNSVYNFQLEMESRHMDKNANSPGLSGETEPPHHLAPGSWINDYHSLQLPQWEQPNVIVPNMCLSSSLLDSWTQTNEEAISISFRVSASSKMLTMKLHGKSELQLHSIFKCVSELKAIIRLSQVTNWSSHLIISPDLWVSWYCSYKDKVWSWNNQVFGKLLSWLCDPQDSRKKRWVLRKGWHHLRKTALVSVLLLTNSVEWASDQLPFSKWAKAHLTTGTTEAL